MSDCFSSFRLCRIRATRLDSVGNPTAGPNNGYVSATPGQIQVTPVIEQGEEKILKTGCGCIGALAKNPDLLKRFDLELDLTKMELPLFELLTGASAILDGSDVIGVNWPSDQTFDCAGSPQPNVAFEGWSDAWDEDHQAASPHRYFHWIWPATQWQFAPATLGDDIFQPKLTGFSKGNSVWGDGIYGDLPEAIDPLGAVVMSDTIPDAACGYISTAIT